jgi:hypothetical protein
MTLRSCLTLHGETPTTHLIHGVLKNATASRLEEIERRLHEGVQNGSLPTLGPRALKRVRSELARRRLQAAFEPDSPAFAHPIASR